MGAIWRMQLYLYNSDDGFAYAVALRQEVATTGGFELAQPGARANLPKQYRMRHITGVDLFTGNRHNNWIADATNESFTSGSSFIYNNVTYQKIGSIGEKRPTRL